VMLGNTVFAFGDCDAIEKKFSGLGTVLRSRVSESGPRLV
jgi:hypothetical protein